MATQKACKSCRSLFTGSTCPKCGAQEATDGFKGRVIVLNADQSEIAKNMKLKGEGIYAIKL